MIRSPDGDTDFFDIVAEILQGDTLTPSMFAICLNYALWMLIDQRKEMTQVQILDETDCISQSTNTLGKGMNPIIIPPAMGK